jgi:hypothetical protein
MVRDGERQAGVDSIPIDENGTRAAPPAIAAFLGSGQVETLAQKVEKRYARIERQFMRLPVNIERARNTWKFAAGCLGFNNFSCGQ